LRSIEARKISQKDIWLWVKSLGSSLGLELVNEEKRREEKRREVHNKRREEKSITREDKRGP
jgi:hypothetical protein